MLLIIDPHRNQGSSWAQFVVAHLAFEEGDDLKYLNNFKGARDYSRWKELHNRNREAGLRGLGRTEPSV